jgi:hypothetical protein
MSSADVDPGRRTRHPHVVMDLQSRQWKAAKIERLLGLAGKSATFEIERADSRASRLLRRIPDALLKPFSRIIPTHIYTFRHGN